MGMLAEGATHLGVATDHVIESFRNDLWPGYKTGAGIEPELRSQFEVLEAALGALGVVVWPMVELEADDALASAAAVAAEDPAVDRVVICTPDKDLAQCVVGERVVQLDRRKGTVTDEDGVWEKFGVAPRSIPDWLALVGDSADGFPGSGRVGQAVGLGGAGPLRDLRRRARRRRPSGTRRARGGAGGSQAGRTAGRRARAGRAVPGPGHPAAGPGPARPGRLPPVAGPDRRVRGGLPALPGPGAGRAGRAPLAGPLTPVAQPVVPKTSSSSVGTGVSSWA